MKSCQVRRRVVGFQGRRIREREEEVTEGLTYVVNLVHSEKSLVGNARDLGLRRVHSEERQPKKIISIDELLRGNSGS